MPYPDEPYNQLTQQYSLSDDLKQTLLETLKIDGMKDIVEGGWITPDVLVKQHTSLNKCFVLSPIKAQMLVLTHQAIRDDERIKSKKTLFSNMLMWLESNDEPYAYIISPSLAKDTLSNDTIITELNKAAKEYPAEMKKWDEIRAEIQEINNLPHSKLTKRKSLATNVIEKIAPLQSFIENFMSLKSEFFSSSIVLFQYINQQTKPLEEAAKIYFEALLKAQGKKIVAINFFSKPDGDQLGRRMQIEYQHPDSKNKHRIMYHIKTHQHGSTSRGSSTKPVDAKELFIYKVFQYIGFGPKVHFFFNSLSRGGFFIATQDAAFTKQTARTKLFSTYEQMRDKNLLSEDEETYTNLSSLDILSRIFNIRDVTTNPSNFGCTLINNTDRKWQILDFRIETYDQYTYNGIFEGFRAGNGMYNYHGFLGNTLRDRPENDRMKTAAKVIDILENGCASYSRQGDTKLPLLPGIEKAYAEIVEYIKENGANLELEIAKALDDLARYKNDIQKNFNELATKIKETAVSRTENLNTLK